MHSSDSDLFREEVSEIPRADQSDLGSSKPSRAYVHARLICPGCHCTKRRDQIALSKPRYS